MGVLDSKLGKSVERLLLQANCGQFASQKCAPSLLKLLGRRSCIVSGKTSQRTARGSQKHPILTIYSASAGRKQSAIDTEILRKLKQHRKRRVFWKNIAHLRMKSTSVAEKKKNAIEKICLKNKSV